MRDIKRRQKVNFQDIAKKKKIGNSKRPHEIECIALLIVNLYGE